MNRRLTSRTLLALLAASFLVAPAALAGGGVAYKNTLGR